ncbi:MAG: geranylgeranyl reductase family protein [Candidatus Woesearchaeota archaeon]
MVGIIGGGPAGLMCAYHLSKKGIKTTIYEEHKTIGKPIQCSGIVTKDILKTINISKETIINRINYVKVFPNISDKLNAKLKINDYIIDRTKFDNQIKDMALNAGAKIFYNKKIININKKNNLYFLKTKNDLFKHKTVISAEGAYSKGREYINNIKPKYYFGKQFIIKGEFKKDTISVFLGDKKQQFFSWIIPENENIARIGSCSISNPSLILSNLLKNNKLDKNKILATQAGLIPIYNPKIKTQKDNFYLVGDSAAQVKATTGGGIIQGLISSKILADCILNKKNYEKQWRKKIGKELLMHLYIRKILNKFTNKDNTDLIKMASKNEDIFLKYNRDNSIKLITSLLFREPRLLKFTKKILF